MSFKPIFHPKSPMNITVTCHGWDPDSGTDTLLDSIQITVWVPVGGSTSKQFHYEVADPKDLWLYLQDLCENPMQVLSEKFNYNPPTLRPLGKVKINLEELEL